MLLEMRDNDDLPYSLPQHVKIAACKVGDKLTASRKFYSGTANFYAPKGTEHSGLRYFPEQVIVHR